MQADTAFQPRVQIELFWGRTSLDVVSVPEENGVVLAGSARSCTVPLPEDLLPSPDFPLLTIRDGEVTVRTGGDPVDLDEGSRMWVELGRLSLLISRVRVRPTRRAPLGQHLEPRFINSLLVALFFALALVSTLLLGPEALGYDQVEIRKTTTRYIRSLISRARPEPRLDVELFRDDLSGREKPKMPAVGRAGKAGKRGMPDTGKRRAVRRVREDDRERLSRMGVLAALGEGPGVLGTLDTTRHGLGGDLMDAIGGITGAEPGPSGGFGGLDVKGTGPGCRGCTGADPLMRGGPIRRSEVSRRSLPETRYHKPTEGPVPEITHLPLRMTGSLSEEIIRSTIRSYRRQIRYCYEQELIRHPELAGKIRVHFVINSRGLVRSADGVSTPSLRGTNLKPCILTKVRTWKFPEPRGGGEVEVFYPFLFAPTGRR
jgi:hypothetical protein